MHRLVICLCDGKLDVLDYAVTRWEMLYHFYVNLGLLTKRW